MTQDTSPNAQAAQANPNGKPGEGEARPQFNLQRVYLSGASVELPMGSATFLDQSEPQLKFDLDTSAKQLNETIFEVSVRCTVTCMLGDKTGFLVEATEAGIFDIHNVTEEQRMLLLGITCPHIVYPYLRANIADLINRASLPPVHLAEINWEAYFQQKQQQAQQAQQAAAGTPSVQ